MVRRKRKRLCKLILTICAATICVCMLLKTVATTLELHTYVIVAEESDKNKATGINYPGLVQKQVRVSNQNLIILYKNK